LFRRIDRIVTRLVDADMELVRVEKLALVLTRIRIISSDKDRGKLSADESISSRDLIINA